eukprot:scaffold34434_cov95-Phaeocystis_antarctica.AAC.2
MRRRLRVRHSIFHKDAKTLMGRIDTAQAIAKASLDHGEQMLAIARQKAPRLASIEGCKLLLQQPSCLRLVIVRMGYQMDLDAPLVAAHWHTHERRVREKVRSSRGGTVHQGSNIAGALSSKWAQPRRAASGSPRGRRASKRATAECCPGRCTPCPAARGKPRVFILYRACMCAVGAEGRCSDGGGRASPARELARRLSSPRAASPSAIPARAWRRAPPSHHSTNGLERRSLPPSPPAPCARGASALLMAQSCCRRGPRRAAGWRAGTGGAPRRVRARRRDRCHRRAPRPPPPLPPQCRARPCAPGGGGCGHDCGAWGEQRTGGRRRSRPQLPSDRVCDAVPSAEHAATQEVEAAHGPHPPQGGAGLHSALAAAAQRGGDRAGGDEEQRSKCEDIYICRASGECCDEVLHPNPRKHDDGSGAHYADGACVGGEESEEKEAGARRVHHEPPYAIANGGLDRLASPEHDRRGQTYLR